jgi:hypothetical protein
VNFPLSQAPKMVFDEQLWRVFVSFFATPEIVLERIGFPVGDARGALHRLCRANGHDCVRCLQPGSFDGPAFDKVDLYCGYGRVLDRDTAELAISLGRAAIAEIKQRAIYIHRQVYDCGNRPHASRMLTRKASISERNN